MMMGTAATGEIDPLWYALLLYAIISGYHLVMILLFGQTGDVLKLLRSRPWVAVSAGFTNAYSYVFLLIAFGAMEVSVVEPVTMLGTVVTVMLSWLMFRERVAPRLPGMALMLAGAAMLFI